MAQMESMEADLFTGKVAFPPTPPVSDSDSKAQHAFKTISETAGMLSLPQHVLRFWESKFNQLKPLKLKGGRRYYRPQDIDTLFTIKQLLYKQGYTIKGARKALSQTKKKDHSVVQERSGAQEKKSRKSAAASLADTPLFQSLAAAPSPAAEANARKVALKAIHAELMELKEMIGLLPELH